MSAHKGLECALIQPLHPSTAYSKAELCGGLKPIGQLRFFQLKCSRNLQKLLCIFFLFLFFSIFINFFFHFPRCQISSSWKMASDINFAASLTTLDPSDRKWGLLTRLECQPNHDLRARAFSRKIIFWGSYVAQRKHFCFPRSSPWFKSGLCRYFSLRCLVWEQYWDQTHLVLSNGFHKRS